MAITGGKTISGLTEITSVGGSEDFVVRLNSFNYKVPYSKLLTKLSTDLGVSNPITTNGDMLIYNTAPTRLPIGSTGQFLTVSASGFPEWSSKTFLTDPTTTNGDLITKSGGILSRIPVGAEGTVLTVSSGAPTWSGALFSSPLTTEEDIMVYRGAGEARLGIGSEGQYLKVSGGLVSWGSAPSSILSTDGSMLIYNSGDSELAIGSEGDLLVTRSGFPVWEAVTIYSDPLTTDGDVLIRSGGVTTRLAAGTADQVLKIDGSGIPVWDDVENAVAINDLIAFNASVVSPSPSDDGFVISWNNTNSEYELIPSSASSFMFQDGVQESLGVVSLGGTTTSSINIDGNSSTYAFSVGDFSSVSLTADGVSTFTSQFIVDSNGARIIHEPTVGGNKQSIELGSSGAMLIVDEQNTRGLEYATDYSANFTNESLVTRRWVDTEFQSKLPLSATALAPSVGQDNYILYWDNTNGVYEMKAEAGAGAVTALGTPVNNQIAVWTGATEIEGDANLTFNGSALAVGNTSISSGSITTSSGNLTLNAVGDIFVSGRAAGTVVSGDLVYFADISDSNKIKTTTAGDIAALGGGGGLSLGSAQYDIPLTNAGLTDFAYDTGVFQYNTSTNQLLVNVGTTASPSYTFAGDTDTGMSSASADNLAFSVGGNERLHISGTSVRIIGANLRMGDTTVISSSRQLQNIIEATVDNVNINGNTVSSTSGNLVVASAGGAVDFSGDNITNAGNLSSGSYTPTYTAVTNVSSVSNLKAYYTRVGNVVDVSLRCSITYTSSGSTSFYISLPIASSISSVSDIVGHGTDTLAGAVNVIVSGDISGNRALVNLTADSGATRNILLSFKYIIA